jgi:hypothetical protein
MLVLDNSLTRILDLRLSTFSPRNIDNHRAVGTLDRLVDLETCLRATSARLPAPAAASWFVIDHRPLRCPGADDSR